MTQVALVTGSSKGIGKAIALRLSRDGYFVYVTYHTDETGGLQTLEQINQSGWQGTLVKLDVRDEQNAIQVMKQIKSEHGHLNVLVHNAGKEIPKNIESLELSEWKAVIDTGLDGIFLCTKHALPLMKEQDNANMIFISSGLESKPDAEFPAYCVSKAGTDAFIKMMVIFLAKYQIRVNAVLPGATNTTMVEFLGGENKQEFWEKVNQNNPLKRTSTPEDIANTVSMIIHDENKYLNGNFIYVNGGSHLK